MESDSNSVIDKYAHDFISRDSYINKIGGYQRADRLKGAYLAYVCLVSFALTFFIAMGITAACLSEGSTAEIMLPIHICIIIAVAFAVLINRWTLNKQYNHTIKLLQKGVFYYDEEYPDEALEDFRRNGLNEIKFLSKFFIYIYHLVMVSNHFLAPLLQMMFIDKDPNQVINPYLPYPFYMPFDTWTYHGFIIACLLSLITMTYVFEAGIVSELMFISTTIQLRIQVEILNYSLQNIERRAARLYCKGEPVEHVSYKEFYAKKEFQKCMYACLRTNARHHIAILRLKKSFATYVGLHLLVTGALATIMIAANLLLIVQGQKFHILVNFLLTLIGELIVVLQYCYYGQKVLTESNKLPESLYSTPWYYCNKPFNRMLGIMMAYAQNPITIRTVVFNCVASMESYGELMSACYKIVSLLKTQD